MVKLILLLLLFRIDNSSTVVDTFDRIEVNHHYNEWGAEVWTQLICWDWNPRKGVFRVEHYIMMKDAYKETEEGKKKWDKKVRDIADKIKDWMTRVDFLSSCRYRGDFVGGKYYPVRGKKIDKTVELIRNNAFFKITLGNCIIRKVNNTIIVSKEY